MEESFIFGDTKTSILKKLITLLALAYCLNGWAQLCFEPNITFFEAGASPSIISNDFNGDGNKDLAIGSSTFDSITIYLGYGNGYFGSVHKYEGGAWSLISADFNGDGKEDLVFSSIDSINILLGTGTGSFGTITKFGIGSTSDACWGVTSADFNSDGKPDVASTTNTGVAILFGTGTGNFTTFTNVAVGNYYGNALISSDFNGDGMADIAVSNGVVLLGDGAGSFTTNTFSATGQVITSSDFNGDNKPDIATTFFNGYNSNLSVVLGTGTGGFGVSNNYTVGANPFSIISADFDGDGNVDLATSNMDSFALSIILGTGTGSFGAVTQFVKTIMAYSTTVTTDDFNGDHKPDLAIVNCACGPEGLAVVLNCNNSTTGISQYSNLNSNISIYPNPATNIINIDISTSSMPNATIVITNMLGNTVKQVSGVNNQVSINVADLSEGVYNISIAGNEGVINKRVVLVK